MTMHERKLEELGAALDAGCNASITITDPVRSPGGVVTGNVFWADRRSHSPDGVKYRRHTEDIRETRGRVVDADELLQEGGKRLQPEERARLLHEIDLVRVDVAACERRSKIRFQVALAIAITWLVLAAARAYFAVSH